MGGKFDTKKLVFEESKCLKLKKNTICDDFRKVHDENMNKSILIMHKVNIFHFSHKWITKKDLNCSGLEDCFGHKWESCSKNVLKKTKE